MKAELLAPAGSFAALHTAIACGADAVYLGLDAFQARAKAVEFTTENIAQTVRRCHLLGVKVYVTCNTCVKADEKERFAQYVDACARAKVDAFIVTDPGMLDIFRRYDIALHASTQMGIHNLPGAVIAEQLGFTRVVLSREALLEDVREIKAHTSLEVEYFVHGALCVSFSGGCLLSSMMSGESGNRGRCNQPCRLPYRCDAFRTDGYLLSPSDQCLVDKLDDLIDAGVDSLKIEGRLKQPHYVGEVVTQYRRVLDRIGKADVGALERAYNRGKFSAGYNYDDSRKLMSVRVQGHCGQTVGRVAGALRGQLIAQLSRPLHAGDGIKLLYKGKEIGGCAVSEIRPDPKRAQQSLIAYPNADKIPIGTQIALTSDRAQIRRYESPITERYVDFVVRAKVGEPLEVVAQCDDTRGCATGNPVQAAQKSATDAQTVRNCMARTGDTVFRTDACEWESDGGFVPVSELNALRRQAIAALEDALLDRWECERQKVDYSAYPARLDATHAIEDRVFVQSDQIDALANLADLPVHLVATTDAWSVERVEEIATRLRALRPDMHDASVFFAVPKIARGRDVARMRGIAQICARLHIGWICDNLYAVGLAREYGLAYAGGIGLNLYQQDAARVLGATRYLASPELRQSELSGCSGATLYAYGPIPVMTLTHCPVQLNSGCDCDRCAYRGAFAYRDKRAQYRLERHRIASCYFTMYNPQPIDLREKYEKTPYQTYLNVVQCKAEEVRELVQSFVRRDGKRIAGATTGHWNRGVL